MASKTPAEKQDRAVRNFISESVYLSRDAIAGCWSHEKFIHARAALIKRACTVLTPKYQDILHYAMTAAYTHWECSQEWVHLLDDGTFLRNPALLSSSQKPDDYLERIVCSSHVYRGTTNSPTDWEMSTMSTVIRNAVAAA